jgi:hypothetical protein
VSYFDVSASLIDDIPMEVPICEEKSGLVN